MRAAEVVRLFEQKLLPVRTVAATNAAFSAYQKEWLPGSQDEAFKALHPLVEQGFDAGYAAAMNEVRSVLLAVQVEVRQAPSTVSPDHPDHPWKIAQREGRHEDAERLLKEALKEG